MKAKLAPTEMFIVDIGSGMVGFEALSVATDTHFYLSDSYL